MSFNPGRFEAEIQCADGERLMTDLAIEKAKKIHEMYEQIIDMYKKVDTAAKYGFLRSILASDELDLYDKFVSMSDVLSYEDGIDVDKLDAKKIDDFLYQFKMGSMS